MCEWISVSLHNSKGTIVNNENKVKKGACTPCDETFTGPTYDEIVVFQQAQVYPMYVLFVK